jgi:glycosyltransferase involved in cell wall biosynthesis
VVIQSDETWPIVSASLKLGLPTAIDVQTTEITNLDAPLLPGEPLLVFAAEPFAAKQFETAYGIDVQVLPLAIDHRRWRIRPAHRRRDTLLYVNPHPVKGLEILRRIAAARPAYRFIVCESWPLSGDWRWWAKSRLDGLANVRWLPPQPDLRPFFARARALLMPSIWEECAARTTMEAQAHGVPVIASRRGGLPGQVGAGGVCVDLHAPLEAWLAPVDRLMTDDAYHASLADAARARAAAPDRDLALVVRDFVAAIEVHARRVRLAQLADAR